MSYNCRSEYISGKLFIQRRVAMEFVEDNEEESFLPESHFFNSLDLSVRKNLDEMLPIQEFRWGGEGSGCTYKEELREILEETKGTAAILFIWESRELSALKVTDGKVEEKKVKITVED